MPIRTTAIKLELNTRFISWDGLGFTFLFDFTGDVGSTFEWKTSPRSLGAKGKAP